MLDGSATSYPLLKFDHRNFSQNSEHGTPLCSSFLAECVWWLLSSQRKLVALLRRCPLTIKTTQSFYVHTDRHFCVFCLLTLNLVPFLIINIPQVMEGVVWKKHGVRAGVFRRSMLGWGQVFLSCLTSPCLVLHWLVLPCLAFSCLVLPCCLVLPAILENRREASNLCHRERIPSQIRVHPR